MSHFIRHGLEVSTMIFSTFLEVASSRYRPRPCLHANSTRSSCDRESLKISEEAWETIVLVFGIMLFMVCGGAVIFRWVCDFMNKFKSSSNTRERPQRIACTSQSQIWSPGDLPPPYEVPSYDDVVIGDLYALGLPPEPPPYCYGPPPGFEPADADEYDYQADRTDNDEPSSNLQVDEGSMNITRQSLEAVRTTSCTDALVREENAVSADDSNDIHIPSLNAQDKELIAESPTEDDPTDLHISSLICDRMKETGTTALR
ncbi:uncharacterized protein [Amphiura filiformis]|uniref:uncharacterized protein n=1 Tax=Amphiura filiformis TaxID=82378 RepID=UPI003B21CF00